MRKVNFKVRNIGSEKYLSYVLDDETDFDEELLDYLDENKITELIDIIYEEDDENDYLTYNITDRTTVGALLSGTVHAEMMLGIIRGVASGIMNMRDLGIPVSYVILNKDFTYVNPVTFDVKMICVPVETEVTANAEFKAFVKDLILNSTYADDEDCNYVAKAYQHAECGEVYDPWFCKSDHRADGGCRITGRRRIYGCWRFRRGGFSGCGYSTG